MTTKVEMIQDIVRGDRLAEGIANRYKELRDARLVWEEEKLETRNYLFATDTKTTTNAKLPWKNSTTVPKLCQIRDNLHANYMAALFSNPDWLHWEAGDPEAIDKETRQALTAYMRTKLADSDFERVISQLVLDYIDYGNCFADVEYVRETYTDAEGETHIKYVGPRVIRINPMDIVFDITASDFERSPKITRHILSIGELEKYMIEHPQEQYDEEVLNKIKEIRVGLRDFDHDDINKSTGFQMDGFGSMSEYYNSGYIEILEFEGDYFDVFGMKLHENRRITVVDRAHVLRNIPIDNLMGRSLKQHVGWRLRPDNLLAMGPLDNLVGMQYRIDHLQNLKSDVFDLVAFPPLKITGQVEDFEWGPFERIFIDDDGSDVDMLAPNVNALNADIEIDWIENKMEELAGAPRQALGIRTPGEKTKYEVQTLENNAGRVFQSKITQFEKQFMEPLINAMLAVSRQNMTDIDTARLVDPTYGYEKFIKITPDIIRSRGKLRPIGARHFADQANRLQNYTNFRNSAAGQDPSVLNHISGIKEAEFVEEMLGLRKSDLVKPNIRVQEQIESQSIAQTGQAQLQAENRQLTLGEEQQVDEETEQAFRA